MTSLEIVTPLKEDEIYIHNNPGKYSIDVNTLEQKNLTWEGEIILRRSLTADENGNIASNSDDTVSKASKVVGIPQVFNNIGNLIGFKDFLDITSTSSMDKGNALQLLEIYNELLLSGYRRFREILRAENSKSAKMTLDPSLYPDIGRIISFSYLRRPHFTVFGIKGPNLSA